MRTDNKIIKRSVMITHAFSGVARILGQGDQTFEPLANSGT